jgi:hypothetical protein
MAAAHFNNNETPLCGQVMKKNPLELTVNKEEVTCKKCIKRLEALKEMAKDTVQDEKDLEARIDAELAEDSDSEFLTEDELDELDELDGMAEVA